VPTRFSKVLRYGSRTNDTLLEDFPEVCYPVRKLERIAQRQRGQMYNGVKTRINWKASKMRLADDRGLGRLRRLRHDVRDEWIGYSRFVAYAGRRTQGFARRLYLSTTHRLASRRSRKRSAPTARRSSRRISSAWRARGEKWRAASQRPVIAENDVAQRLLDRTRNPEFRGERYQLMKSFPKNLDLWEEYRQIREAELLADGDGSQATEFIARIARRWTRARSRRGKTVITSMRSAPSSMR